MALPNWIVVYTGRTDFKYIMIMMMMMMITKWFVSLRLHGVDLSSNMDANGDTFPQLPSYEKEAHSNQ